MFILHKSLSDPGAWGPIYGSRCLSVCLSLSERHCANITDETLADQATNTIQTDDAKWQSKAMWQCSDLKWWTTLEPMQVALPDDRISS